ncbi:hypothetical protein MTR67_026740 [Solanum verrucosum]|uniref:Uncharacterized protein n=1 Tax=Solanum verrucosum TaxID=315347 RepID=A0AAF0TZB3_SOLVR|nr:hypothetical protein MTR67_026740 [Solanum verrucosum]
MSFLKGLVGPGVLPFVQATQAPDNPPVARTAPKTGGTGGNDVFFRPLLGSVMTKALAKRAKNSGNFAGSYSRSSGRPTLEAKPI